MPNLVGRRRPDVGDAGLNFEGILPGDYWKELAPDGSPLDAGADARARGNLTGGVWWVAAPMPDNDTGYMLGRLTNHTVREEEDGTISVRPGDGSSNSILISRGDRSFHGYIEHGVWRSV